MGTQTPQDWLIRQFEENLRKWESGEIFDDDLGLGECREMIEVFADDQEHAFPHCFLCGWDPEYEAGYMHRYGKAPTEPWLYGFLRDRR